MALRSRRRGADATAFDRALRRSLRAAIEGDAARAQTWLERAVELDSADLDAYHALARLYRNRGEIGRAIRMHQNLVLRSDLPREELAAARLELARDFEAGGFRERALAAYEELLAERPRDPEVMESAASALIDSGEVARANEILRRLRRHDRERASHVEQKLAASGEGSARPGARGTGLVSRLVTGLTARGREEAAERELAERLARDPGDHAARVARARALAGHGQPERAREELSRALERFPEAWALHVELGRQWLASGQEREALEAYAGLLDALEAVGRRAAEAAADPAPASREAQP